MWKRSYVLLAGVLLPCAFAAAQSSVDPIDLYRQAAAQLTAAPAMTFHVEKRFDAVLIDGAKVEYSGALDVMVKSTGGLFLDYGDDLSSRRVWYDGKTVTLLDSINNVYASTPASGSVAEVLVQVNEKHGLEMPLAPLLEKDLIDKLEAHGKARYLGIHDVEGEPCHHLLFRGRTNDLQVWISTGEQVLLRKFVITFWDREGTPQQSLIFSDWNLNAEIDAEVFEAQVPEDALRIEFLSVGGQE
jgi:hypothetical protein